MIKGLLLSIFFIPMSLLTVDNTVCACSIDNTISVKEQTTAEFYNASIIFLGEVIKIEDMDTTPIGKLKPFDVPFKYTFKVTEMIKGKDVQTIDIYSTQSDVYCGYSFESSTKYLVHSKKTIKFQEYTPKTWSNTTSECMGNSLRHFTEKKKLDILRKLAKS